MPVLEVELVLRDDEILAEDLAGRIADAAGEVFDAAPGTTWVRLRTSLPSSYGESGGGPPADTHPVFVRVLKADIADGETLSNEAVRLTETLAAIIGRPLENVHLIYEPAARGRVAFGGKLVL